MQYNVIYQKGLGRRVNTKRKQHTLSNVKGLEKSDLADIVEVKGHVSKVLIQSAIANPTRGLYSSRAPLCEKMGYICMHTKYYMADLIFYRCVCQ